MVNLFQAVDAYLLVCRAEGRRVPRKILYDFAAYIGDCVVAELSKDRLRMYTADLAARAPANRSIQRFLQWMYVQKFISEPLANVRPPRRQTRRSAYSSGTMISGTLSVSD